MSAAAAEWPPTVVKLEQDDDGRWYKVYEDGGRRATLSDHDHGRRDQDAPHVPAQDVAGRDWLPRNLTSYLDGTYEPPRPSLLRRQDGACLLYRGRTHWISGEPESCKSWLAQLACAQALAAGEHVVYLDLEDGPDGVTRRLLDLGVDPVVIAERFFYVQPESALGPMRRERLQPYVEASALFVIDACTESLAQQGLSSKDDTDIAQWLEILPRWAARLGPAVVVLDHVVKDAESRGRWATGSQHKLAGLDGVAYSLETVQPAGRGLTGRSRLFVSKDRHGQVRGPVTVPSTGGRHWAGDLVVDSGLVLDAVVHPPAVTSDEPFRPAVLMTRISEVLAGAGRPLTSRDIEDRVTGKAQSKRQALAALVDDGHVDVIPGAHNSKQHVLLKPFPTPEETP